MENEANPKAIRILNEHEYGDYPNELEDELMLISNSKAFQGKSKQVKKELLKLYKDSRSTLLNASRELLDHFKEETENKRHLVFLDRDARLLWHVARAAAIEDFLPSKQIHFVPASGIAKMEEKNLKLVAEYIKKRTDKGKVTLVDSSIKATAIIQLNPHLNNPKMIAITDYPEGYDNEYPAKGLIEGLVPPELSGRIKARFYPKLFRILENEHKSVEAEQDYEPGKPPKYTPKKYTIIEAREGHANESWILAQAARTAGKLIAREKISK